MTEPTSVKVFKLLERRSFRDKLCRVVQYGAKLVGWLLEQEGISDELRLKVKGLESSISMGRKLFRIGKSFDHLRIALLTIHLKDPVQRVVITLSKISSFLFLFTDHLVWMAKLKLFSLNPDRWSRHSMRFWFMSIMLNLARDMYDLSMAFKVEISRVKHQGTVARKNALYRTVLNNRALVLDTFKNCTDVVLPLSRMEMGKGISDGWVGLMGIISSVCFLATIWNESLKLRYS
jgi:hypothetical protein